ncbi:MAG: GIY-YIG nuclease family protein [Cyclobacteriaceae bacterium]
MCYVYILRSKKFNKHYTGQTKNLNKRIEEHNSGKTKSIKAYIPFELIYFEEFSTRKEALEREKYFKSGCGR